MVNLLLRSIRIFKLFMKIRVFLNPQENLSTENIFYAFCGTNIHFTKGIFKIKLIRSTVFLSELVLCNDFIWVSISTYAYNGTAKVPISAKIGVRVQGLTSKIWNQPTYVRSFFLEGNIFTNNYQWELITPQTFPTENE